MEYQQFGYIEKLRKIYFAKCAGGCVRTSDSGPQLSLDNAAGILNTFYLRINTIVTINFFETTCDVEYILLT